MRLIPAADLSKTLAAWRRSHLHSATSFPSFRIEYEAWQALTRMLPFRGNQGTESDGFELLLGHLIDHLQLIFADAAKGSTKCDYPKLEGPNLDDLDRIHALLETEALDTVNRGTYLRYLAETRRLVLRPLERVPLIPKRFPCGYSIEPPIDFGSGLVNAAAPSLAFPA